MRLRRVQCGFIPLADCAPLVVAREFGFAAGEGIDLVLGREPSWSALRDRMALGHYDVAHMLSPVPVAMSMGLGGLHRRIDALMVLSVNGNVIGTSPAIAARMRANGATETARAETIGRALIAAADGRLRIGVPFPFSMHAELLYYWLNALGLAAPRDLVIRAVPPQRMAEAMALGEIDAFCVGEPWGSIAVERGVAELVLPGCAIWRFAPEKVLAARHEWVETQPETVAALMRALWRAARWLADETNRAIASEILARPGYVDVPAEILERALTRRLAFTQTGALRDVPGLLEFFAGAATFPWHSQAVWIASRLAQRAGSDPAEAARIARQCFRADLYRANLAPIGADIPLDCEKPEGELAAPRAIRSSRGHLTLGPDAFFDHRVFDPADQI